MTTPSQKVTSKENRIILDLCGGTGAWSKPYKDAGYDVRVITLPEWDINLTGKLNNDLIFYSPDKQRHMSVNIDKVYGVLAAPPCTEFSVAKGNKPRDFEGGMHTVTSCLWVVWKCRLSHKLGFWALENPRGFLRQFLGIPSFHYEHWEYGDPQIKPTDIWGYFKHPAKKVKVKPNNLTVKYGSRINGRGWGSPKPPKELEHLGLDRAAIRAITPAGFAKAFMEANL